MRYGPKSCLRGRKRAVWRPPTSSAARRAPGLEKIGQKVERMDALMVGALEVRREAAIVVLGGGLKSSFPSFFPLSPASGQVWPSIAQQRRQAPSSGHQDRNCHAPEIIMILILPWTREDARMLHPGPRTFLEAPAARGAEPPARCPRTWEGTSSRQGYLKISLLGASGFWTRPNGPKMASDTRIRAREHAPDTPATPASHRERIQSHREHGEDMQSPRSGLGELHGCQEQALRC